MATRTTYWACGITAGAGAASGRRSRILWPGSDVHVVDRNDGAQHPEAEVARRGVEARAFLHFIMLYIPMSTARVGGTFFADALRVRGIGVPNSFNIDWAILVWIHHRPPVSIRAARAGGHATA